MTYILQLPNKLTIGCDTVVNTNIHSYYIAVMPKVTNFAYY